MPSLQLAGLFRLYAHFIFFPMNLVAPFLTRMGFGGLVAGPARYRLPTLLATS